MLKKFSNNCTRDNLDKSVEFIFDNSEGKIEANILRNEELCSSENHKLTVKTSLIEKKIQSGVWTKMLWSNFILKFVC